jgi:hypothetical protein
MEKFNADHDLVRPLMVKIETDQPFEPSMIMTLSLFAKSGYDRPIRPIQDHEELIFPQVLASFETDHPHHPPSLEYPSKFRGPYKADKDVPGSRGIRSSAPVLPFAHHLYLGRKTDGFT